MEKYWIIKGYVPEQRVQRIIFKIIGIVCLACVFFLILFAIKNTKIIIWIPLCLLLAAFFLIDKKIKFDTNGVWLRRKSYIDWKYFSNISYNNDILTITFKEPNMSDELTINVALANRKYVQDVKEMIEFYNTKK